MDPHSSRFDLHGVIDHLHEGVQVIGRDFTYLYLNEVAARHGRRRVDELTGQRMMDVYPGIESTEMFALLRRAMEGEGPQRMENEFVYPDGSKGWFELFVEAVPAGVVVLSLDITERKTLDLHYRRAQRMEAVGLLAGGVAHDFNNLLTVIQGYASIALKDLGPEHPLSEDLSVVLGATASASALTRKLMSFARQLPVEPRTVSVPEAVEHVAALSRGALGERIQLRAASEDGLSVHMDPSSLEQVLLNLVLNARDAMPAGGSLEVNATRIVVDEAWALGRDASLEAGHYVVLSVTDTGTGMPPEVLDRVFDPFFTTKGEKGTGLGLSTCWGLVRQAGGTMSVYSEVGVGTTFKLFLPLAGAEAVPAVAPTSSGALREGTILLVDDQEGLREVVSGVLRRAGYRVVEASDGAEALALSTQLGTGLDLLLTDVSMPGMNGAELAARLRAGHPGARVLLMSGLTERGERGPATQGTPVLAKPFTPALLLGAVEAALSGASPGGAAPAELRGRLD